jgi:hypothetical protein
METKMPLQNKRRIVLVFGAVVCAGMQAAFANVKQATLNVNLVNPVTAAGDGLSQIQFSVQSPGIGLRDKDGNFITPISVSSTAPNRYVGGGVQAGVQVAFSSTNVVDITLTPLRVYRPGENVQFSLTVGGTNSIRITGNDTGGSRPVWFNNGTPPKALAKGPILPGFMVTTKDADYTAYDDLDDPYSIQNLQIFPDITQSTFDAIDLNAVLAESPNPASPAQLIDLSADGGSFDDPGLPDPAPGDVFAAVGQLVDPSDDQIIGSFAEGVTTEVPEPASLALLLIGLGVLSPRRSKPRA